MESELRVMPSGLKSARQNESALGPKGELNQSAERGASKWAFVFVRRSSLQVWLLVLLFFLLYARVIGVLVSMWWGHDRLEGFIIPFISGYLVWVKRKELQQARLRPTVGLGVPIIVLAGISLRAGEAGGVAILGQVSLIVMIAGLILLLGGRAYLKVVSVAVAYLFFMVPIAEDIVAPLHWQFQLLTARQGVALLQTFGFPALLESEYIVLPHITLEVARVCSGVNYLISIVAIGIPLAYLKLRTWWGRATLMLAGVAVGVLANWFRVLLIAIWTYLGGQVLHGPYHIFQGMFVGWVGYVFLFVAAWSLWKVEYVVRGRSGAGAGRNPVKNPIWPQVQSSRLWSRADVPHDTAQASHVEVAPKPLDGNPVSFLTWNRAWCTAVLILTGFAIYLAVSQTRPVGLKESFGTFPSFIGGWVGEVVDIQKALFRVEGADEELARIYRDHRGDTIEVYVGYLTSQLQGKEAVNYLTAQLHEDTREVKIQIDPDQFVSVNERHLRDGRKKRRLLFWYDVNGRVIADRHRAKLATILDSLLRGRSNGGFVLLAIDSFEGVGVEGEKEEDAFIRHFVVILRRHLP